jgi:aspartyl/asparaginyl beta-hydroxylase (cupin superfamily)
MATANPETIARAGLDALRRGDAAQARAAFERATGFGNATAHLWLLLALACEMQGDVTATDRAVDRVLAEEPGNVYALTMKGDAVSARGDDRAAAAYWNAALTSLPAGTLPPDLVPRIQRAQAGIDEMKRRFSSFLTSHLERGGIVPEAQPRRFRDSIAIASGEQQVYLQQPTSFFYPGLPHIAFYEREAFDWVPALEAAAPAMRAELEAMLVDEIGLETYVQTPKNRPHRGHALMDDPRWSAFHLFLEGERIDRNADRCPATLAALAHAPIPNILARSPQAMFSVLRPHVHIPPHFGTLNTRLVVHIPLIVPPNCRLRVGAETRTVEAGKAMIFDDSIEHEAWNDSDETRVVLLFEIWRPELDAAERAALTTLYGAITAYERA